MMSQTLDQWFAQFLREREFLRNLRPASLRWHRLSWHSLLRSVHPPPLVPADLSRATLETFVYALRQRSVRPITVNNRLRSVHTFFRWLHEQGALPTLLRLRPLKVEQRVVPTLVPATIQAMVRFRPPALPPAPSRADRSPLHGQKAFALWRIQALACTLLDTGCRVQELLDAAVEDLDMNDLLLTVVGKGDRQRRVPFSPELRKLLYRYLQQRAALNLPPGRLFPEYGGGPWTQRNALRSFYLWQQRLGLPTTVGFHRLRHTFATEYLRRGGDLVRLSRSLGHQQVSTTMHYLHLVTDDLSREHTRISLLTRWH